jgi:hypothetical protein
VNRIVLGNGPKIAPHLGDTWMAQELSNLSGLINGTFAIDENEKFYPERIGRLPQGQNANWGSASGSIFVENEMTILEDVANNFYNIGVQSTDQVTINSLFGPLIFSVRQVLSRNRLELTNPHGYQSPTGEVIQYRIDTSGTQFMVSKLFRGNDFPTTTWGAAVLITEAGLLLSNGLLFNRVVFAPHLENAGLILQPATQAGSELSVRFEAVITF